MRTRNNDNLAPEGTVERLACEQKPGNLLIFLQIWETDANDRTVSTLTACDYRSISVSRFGNRWNSVRPVLKGSNGLSRKSNLIHWFEIAVRTLWGHCDLRQWIPAASQQRLPIALRSAQRSAEIRLFLPFRKLGTSRVGATCLARQASRILAILVVGPIAQSVRAHA